MTCIQVMGQSPEAGTEPALQPTGRRWVLSGAAGQSTARQQGPEVSHRALKPRGEPGRTSEQPVRSREGSGAVVVPGAVGVSQSSRLSGVLQSSRSLEQHVVIPSGAGGLSQSSLSSGARRINTGSRICAVRIASTRNCWPHSIAATGHGRGP